MSFDEDMSKIDEEKRRMYVDLVNRVNLILPDINRKEIVKNFSKVSYVKRFLVFFLPQFCLGLF